MSARDALAAQLFSAWPNLHDSTEPQQVQAAIECFRAANNFFRICNKQPMNGCELRGLDGRVVE